MADGIVLLSFFVFSLFMFGGKDIHAQQNQADKIFLGGDIITVDDNNPEAQAIAVHEGKIQAIGSETEVSIFRGSKTEVIDLKGNTLLPGFIDIHTHPILSSLMGETIDISGFNHKNQAEVMESLKKGIEEKGRGKWVLAYGWDPAILRNLEAPTLEDLDQMAPENPLFIIAQTLHSGFANSLALEAAGITKDTPNPEGGYFDKDENGELTGLIVEVGAMAKLSTATPKYPWAAYAYLLTKQMETYSKAGYTTIVAPGLQPIIPKHIQSLQEVAEHPNTPVRVFTYPLFDKLDKSDFKPSEGNHQFKVLGPKFWVDGSPYAGGMAMNEPYLDNEFTRNRLGIKSGEKGRLNYEDERLSFLVNKFHKEGWQIAAHVQGERAAKQFLNAVEAAQQSFPRKDYRHRMEHNALVTSEQLKRAFRLGVTPSFYIDHIYYYGDALKEVIVGPKRASRFMPINSAKKAGHRFTIHTDSPSSPIGVLREMRVAVTRNTRSGKYVLGHDEMITVDDAIKAVTINAAWQIFEEDTRGSLEVGKLADFTVLSGNLKKIPPEDWKSIEIVGTYLAGEPTVNEGWSWRKISLMIRTVWGMIFD
ncbi:MAG: amidohydrolase family protein [Candidatus Poseidoniia archaeon]|nr:amidohydrolase family protein [Candidatus Poseidoniia archaeon]